MKNVGGCAATGDGDVMLRFSPSFDCVINMENGMSPSQAAEKAISRISKFYKSFQGGVIAMDKNGDFGAACYGMKDFPFSVQKEGMVEAEVYRIGCGIGGAF